MHIPHRPPLPKASPQPANRTQMRASRTPGQVNAPQRQSECVPLRGGESTECGPRRTLAEQGQDVSAVLAPIGEFIADVPAPGSDHRKHEPPTLREQKLIDVRIARTDLLWHVGDVKLDGPTAARFEVDEQQAVTGAEEVARMRFAVQQLLGSTAAVDPFTSAVQRAEEETPVGLSEGGGFVTVRD